MSHFYAVDFQRQVHLDACVSYSCRDLLPIVPHVSHLPWHTRDRFSVCHYVSSIPCIPETNSLGHTSLISALAILRQNHLVSPLPLRRDSLTVPHVSLLLYLGIPETDFYVSFCIINTLHPRDRLSWSHKSHFCLGNPETESLGHLCLFQEEILLQCHMSLIYLGILETVSECTTSWVLRQPKLHFYLSIPKTGSHGGDR
jgi:hypothetical protein